MYDSICTYANGAPATDTSLLLRVSYEGILCVNSVPQRAEVCSLLDFGALVELAFSRIRRVRGRKSAFKDMN